MNFRNKNLINKIQFNSFRVSVFLPCWSSSDKCVILYTKKQKWKKQENHQKYDIAVTYENEFWLSMRKQDMQSVFVLF